MTTGKVVLMLAAIAAVSLYTVAEQGSLAMLAYTVAVIVLAFAIMLTHERPTTKLRRWRPFERGQ